MSSFNPETAEEPSTTHTIDDPEGSKRDLRLNQIFDARQKAKNSELEARSAMYSGRVTESQAALYYRAALEQYIMELEALSNSTGDDHAAYWREEPLGTLTISPARRSAGELVVEIDGRERQVDEISPEFKQVEIDGLRDVLELPEEITEEFEACVQSHVSGTKTKTLTQTEVLDFDILKRAFRLTDALRAEMGIELEFDGEEKDRADPI